MERGGGPGNGKGPWGGGYHGAAAAWPDSGAEREWTPWIVPSFLAANVAFFVVAMYVNDCPAHSNPYRPCVAGFLHRLSFQPLRQNPLFGPSSSTLEKLGALVWVKVVHQNQGWRLVTCIWLHAGVIHLLANMLSLVFIGIRLEQQFGFVRIGMIYLLSGFGGSIFSSLFIRNSISVGASGALFGLLGAMLSELITNWSIYTKKANFKAASFKFQITPVLSELHGSHALLFGFVLLLRPQFGWVGRCNLPAANQVKSKHKAYQHVLCACALLLLIAGFVVGLVMLFRGVNGNDHCKWCHHLNCVPTSKWSCGN